MIHDGANWRMMARRAALALIAAAWLFASFDGAAVHAQSIMRSPSFNIAPRLPRINPSLAARRNPTITGRTVAISRTTPVRSVPRIGAGSTLPYVRYSPQHLSALQRWLSRRRMLRISRCRRPMGAAAAPSGKNGNNIPRRDASQAALNLRTVANEIVAEIDGALSDAQADELARRHGLVRLESQNFPLIGATIGLFRIADRRAVETVSRELAADASVRSVQPNFRYVLQDQKTALTEGDPAQYAVAKLRLPEAHKLAHGANVTIAVIDSGIDVKHPELASCDCRQLRCTRQQGRSTCPRHRRGRRDRVACAADGERTGGQDFGDPRLRHACQAARKAPPS